MEHSTPGDSLVPPCRFPQLSAPLLGHRSRIEKRSVWAFWAPGRPTWERYARQTDRTDRTDNTDRTDRIMCVLNYFIFLRNFFRFRHTSLLQSSRPVHSHSFRNGNPSEIQKRNGLRGVQHFRKKYFFRREPGVWGRPGEALGCPRASYRPLQPP